MFQQVLVVFIIFGSIAWVIERIINRISLNRERMKLIERGGDLTALHLEKAPYPSSNYSSLKSGLIAIGVAAGSLAGSFFEQNKVLANKEMGYIFSIALFVGLSLIISHYLLKKERKNNRTSK